MTTLSPVCPSASQPSFSPREFSHVKTFSCTRLISDRCLACKHLSFRKAGSFCPLQQLKCQAVITVQGMTDISGPSSGLERVTSNSKQQSRPGPRWLAWDNHGCAGQGGKPHPPPIMSQLCPAGSAQSHPSLLAHGPGSHSHFQGRAGTASFTQQTAELSDAQSEVARSTSPVGLNLEKPQAQRAFLQQERAPVGKEVL